MTKKEKQNIKEEEYFIKMLDFVKEDIEAKRHKTASFHSAFQNKMSIERFNELLLKHNLKYDFE